MSTLGKTNGEKMLEKMQRDTIIYGIGKIVLFIGILAVIIKYLIN